MEEDVSLSLVVAKNFIRLMKEDGLYPRVRRLIEEGEPNLYGVTKREIIYNSLKKCTSIEKIGIFLDNLNNSKYNSPFLEINLDINEILINFFPYDYVLREMYGQKLYDICCLEVFGYVDDADKVEDTITKDTNSYSSNYVRNFGKLLGSISTSVTNTTTSTIDSIVFDSSNGNLVWVFDNGDSRITSVIE